VRIICYCDTFDNTRQGLWNGVMVRIDILPFTVDTTCAFCTPHVRIHYSDFATGMSQSTFSVVPGDTLYKGTYTVAGTVIHLERHRGGRIEIEDINAPLHIEGTYSLAGRIERGRLVGKIE